MTPDLKIHLSNILNESITDVSSVSGGDISSAYKIETPKNAYFLKTNSSFKALEMFQAEANGLELIRNTNAIKTPKVIACNSFENDSYLLMEFIESKSPSSEDFQKLGSQLAKLHACTSDYFGLNDPNFIGSLPQSNAQHNSWIGFYIKERLSPQLERAKRQQLLQEKECPSHEKMDETLRYLFEDIKPSLLHGDLWSGNYLISNDGEPYLIDPAVYYGHYEVDIAMSKLFGGFGQSFYEAYYKFHSNDENTNSRIEIYQLYYLFVHLNLFGSSYYNSVKSILKKYF